MLSLWLTATSYQESSAHHLHIYIIIKLNAKVGMNKNLERAGDNEVDSEQWGNKRAIAV